MLIGHCANEPEIRSVGSGKVANISIATNERRSDGQGGFTESVDWHRITLWNNLADLAANYIHKGSRIYIEGRLRTNTYQDKNHPDVTHRTYEIVAEQVILLDRRQDQDNAGYQEQPQRPNANWGGAQSQQFAGNNSFETGFNAVTQQFGNMQPGQNFSYNQAPANVGGMSSQAFPFNSTAEQPQQQQPTYNNFNANAYAQQQNAGFNQTQSNTPVTSGDDIPF